MDVEHVWECDYGNTWVEWAFGIVLTDDGYDWHGMDGMDSICLGVDLGLVGQGVKEHPFGICGA